MDGTGRWVGCGGRTRMATRILKWLTFTEMGKVGRFGEIIENFIVDLISLRLLMRHASGDISQVTAFVGL